MSKEEVETVFCSLDKAEIVNDELTIAEVSVKSLKLTDKMEECLLDILKKGISEKSEYPTSTIGGLEKRELVTLIDGDVIPKTERAVIILDDFTKLKFHLILKRDGKIYVTRDKYSSDTITTAYQNLLEECEEGDILSTIPTA